MTHPRLSPPAGRRRRTCLWMTALLVCLPGCEKPKPVTLTMPALPPKAVSVATVTTRDVPIYLDAEGETTAYQMVNVVARVEGQITEMPFQQGSLVKRGDKLAVIYPDPYQAAVDKAEGQVNTDHANLKLASDTLDRNRLMLPEKLVSQQQIDVLEAQVNALKGQLQVDEALLKTARINLGYTVITAPVEGMVGTYRINVGNVIKADDLPITTIQTLDPIYADFVISETDFPLMRKFFNANGGKLKVHVRSLSDSTAERDGDLTILGNAVAATTGTVSLRATIENSDRLFWPNQPIHVRILLNTLPNAMVVPESAVLLSQQGEFVFVVGTPAKAGDLPPAEMRPVQTGQTQEDGTKVVTAGLKPGEQVVVQGQVFLAPTMPLIITELNGKPTAAAQATASTATAPAPAAASVAAASASGSNGAKQ